MAQTVKQKLQAEIRDLNSQIKVLKGKNRMENETEIIAIEIFWSVEDQMYITWLKSQPGVSTFGKTIKKSLREFSKVLPTIIEMDGFRSIGTAGKIHASR